MSANEPTTTTVKQGNRALQVILGLVFLLPAVMACGVSQFLLTAGTLMTSMQKVGFGPQSTFIGGQNYVRLLQDSAFWNATSFTVTNLLVRLLAVAVIPVLLAWGASTLSRVPRGVLRVFFTIPLAVFIPFGLALLWRFALRPGSSLLGPTAPSPLSRPELARSTLLSLDGLAIFALACGLGLLLFLPVFRRPPSDRRPWGALIAAWVLLLLGTSAAALQSFTFSYVLTGGGPATSTTSLGLFIFNVSFRYIQIGYGSAADVFLLGVLMLMGLIAGFVVILTRLRVGLFPEDGTNSKGGVLRILALALAVILGLGAIIVELIPFFTSSGGGGRSSNLQDLVNAGTWVNTFLPPLVSVVFIQLPITYLGALGIGGLRPLGRRSEWLLLPFFPWLFVGIMPFGVQAFQIMRQLGWLGTFNALISPLAVSIPALVILTLFFKGQQAAWRQAQAAGAPAVGSFFRHLVLPSLPLAAFLACVGYFVNLVDPFWPMLVANRPELQPASLALLMMANSGSINAPALAGPVLSFTIPVFLLTWIVFAVFQVVYLDRLMVSSGVEE